MFQVSYLLFLWGFFLVFELWLEEVLFKTGGNGKKQKLKQKAKNKNKTKQKQKEIGSKASR